VFVEAAVLAALPNSVDIADERAFVAKQLDLKDCEYAA
jgi:hypothetical protein